MRPTFLPWIKQLIAGLLLTAAGLVLTATARSESPVFAVIGLSICAIGIVFMRRAAAREHGQRVERDAIKKLTQVAQKNGFTVQPNMSLKSGGDLDLLVIKSDGTRIAVEIKSQEGVLLKRTLFGTKESLVRLNGKKFDRDPCEQVLAAAKEIDALPALWLPSKHIKEAKTFRLKNGVVVVQGGVPQLQHALGLKKSWWSF